MEKGPSKYPYVWTGVIEEAEEGKAKQMRYKIGGKWFSCWHKSFSLLVKGGTTDVGYTITESNGKTYNNIQEIGDLGALKPTAEAPKKEDKKAPTSGSYKDTPEEKKERNEQIRRQASMNAAAQVNHGSKDVKQTIRDADLIWAWNTDRTLSAEKLDELVKAAKEVKKDGGTKGNDSNKPGA